jgi:peptidoglycan/LPS O-acetylase OafA/YrhL
MEAIKVSGGRFYRPELDVLRFVAFLLVFLHHTLPNGGDVRINRILGGFASALYAFTLACGFGLSLFFTLSAFLICELLLRERETWGTIGIKQFYIRRILRIWPLYYFGLALGLIFALLPGGQPSDIASIGWFAIFMGAWLSAMHGWVSNPIGPMWSISVEEQFYLFAPWILKYFTRKSLYAFCALIILAASGWLYYLGKVSARDYSLWGNSVVQFECFAAGILLCLILRGQVPRFSMWHRIMFLLGCSFCWFYASYGLNARMLNMINPGSWPLIGGYALASLGSVFLLVAILGVEPRLLPAWVIYLGRISFGLYVYHKFAMDIIGEFDIVNFLHNSISNYPLRVFLDAGSTIGLPLVLTFLMAALSYRFIETPFLKMKKRHSVIDSQPIVGAG